GHSYSFNAEAGQVVRVRLEPFDAELKVRLIGPDGTVVAKLDPPTAGASRRLCLRLARHGLYQLDVKAAWTGARLSRYRIALAPPQPPGSGDEAGLEAEEGLAKADALARAEDEDSHAQALQSDQAAVASFHKAGDGIGEGDALLQLGAHQDQFGQKREALETLAAARTLWTSLDQSYGAAVAAAQLGQINSEMGEN